MKTLLMSAKEAADFLGLNVFTLYKYTREKRIAHFRMGGQRLVRYKEEDLIAFLEKQRVPVRDEVKYVY